MSAPLSSSFEMQGQVAGFFRDVFGNRQLVIRDPKEEVFFEIPKALKHELEGTLAVGQEVVVTGWMASGEASGRRRWIASQVRQADSVRPTLPLCIRICANKKCWRNGGQALWKELEQKIEAADLRASVTLKAVPCMDMCKQGPNVDVGGQEFHHCSPRTAGEILAPFAERADVNPSENACSLAPKREYCAAL